MPVHCPALASGWPLGQEKCSHERIGLQGDPELLSSTLVSGLMTGWDVGNFCPDVIVRQGLGQAGEIEVETRVSRPKDLQKDQGFYPTMFQTPFFSPHRRSPSRGWRPP